MSVSDPAFLHDDGAKDILRGGADVLERRRAHRYAAAKGTFDILCVAAGMPAMVAIAALLLVLNPVFNPGPLFFRQQRMGLGGRPFVMWKFRTMLPCSRGLGIRGADEVLEEDRITPLGRTLRKMRLDELPNLINVWKGEMSVVGPRPDAWEHASLFIATVPRYHQRFSVKPGITGLAQVRGGYADNPRAIVRKARFDSHYVQNRRVRLEAHILWSTIMVMLTGKGAK